MLLLTSVVNIQYGINQICVTRDNELRCSEKTAGFLLKPHKFTFDC